MRGLRQGDPLSPYLFLFVAEGLTAVIQDAISRGVLKEFKICRRSPGISHLLVADDTLLFVQTNIEQAQEVKKAIKVFEKGTSQLISPNKCSILFSKDCPLQTQTDVKHVLEIQQSTFEEKYLGFPTVEGRAKANKLKTTNDSLGKKMNDWNEKFMSMAAKEVLIKSVVQSTSTFIMGLFKLPMSFHDDYMKITRQFWWGKTMKNIGFTGLLGKTLLNPKL
jgi:hypothetical protein